MPTQTTSQHTFTLLVIEKLRKDASSHFKHFHACCTFLLRKKWRQKHTFTPNTFTEPGLFVICWVEAFCCLVFVHVQQR